jgi:predicted anti-sigma-YlaC factor YlaD
MSHLGERLSALIDGELGDAERDRVLTHLAGCDDCRQEAVALRALKNRMHSLGEAMVDAALTGRLMAMALPPDGRPWTARQPWRPRAAFPAARMLAAGILASAVAGVGAAAFFAGGEQQAPGPRVTPAVGSFLAQHAIVTGDVPVTPASRPGATASAARAAVASGVTGAAGSAVPAGRQPGGHEPGGTRPAAGHSSRSRPAGLLKAAGMTRRGLQQGPAIVTLVPVPAGPLTATASPGP